MATRKRAMSWHSMSHRLISDAVLSKIILSALGSEAGACSSVG